MMDDLPTQETASMLLTIPTEIRLQIYSYILPSTHLLVDLCPAKNSKRAVYGTSIVGSLLKQHIEFANYVRINGLQLMLTCKAIRTETLPLFKSIIARFHCEKCYAYFLKSMSQGYGVGLKWLRKIEVEIFMAEFSGLGQTQSVPRLLTTRVSEAMQALQKLTWSYYGRLDLMEREKWFKERLRDEEAGLDPDNETVPLLHSAAERGGCWLVRAFFDTSIRDEGAI